MTIEKLPPLLVITGPTACGKTATAASIAIALDTEIISADSVQVYKHFDIGSAKPAADVLAMARHHLISVAEPEEEFNVARFTSEAGAIVRGLLSRGRMPIVAGGTGLYIKALSEGFHLGVKISPDVEKRMDEAEASDGMEALFRLAVEADPEWMGKVHPNDRFRTRRALGVFWTVGRRLSDIYRENPTKPSWDTLAIALDVPRETLFKRIDARVGEMLDSGWIDEVKRLRETGYNMSVKPMRSLGYRTIYNQLEGLVDPAESPEIIRRETRAYAKRQMTWFRGAENLVFLPAGHGESPEGLAHSILARDDVKEFISRHRLSAGV